MATAREYQTLVARCGSWSVEDLGDLLHEIDRDRDLGEEDRSTLQSQMYQLIWNRARPHIRRQDGHFAECDSGSA